MQHAAVEPAYVEVLPSTPPEKTRPKTPLAQGTAAAPTTPQRQTIPSEYPATGRKPVVTPLVTPPRAPPAIRVSSHLNPDTPGGSMVIDDQRLPEEWQTNERLLHKCSLKTC